MNKITNFQIGEQLWVVTEPLQRTTAPPATSVDHVFVIDCSGSMSADLPKLRTHIKSRISKILKLDDTFTLIWFSGRDEFGIILENVTATNLRELKSIHDAIDRWLRPVGLTGFLQPLQALAARLQTGNPKNVVFMSDGADNQWARTHRGRSYTCLKRLVVLVSYAIYRKRCLTMQGGSSKPCLVGSRRH